MEELDRNSEEAKRHLKDLEETKFYKDRRVEGNRFEAGLLRFFEPITNSSQLRRQFPLVKHGYLSFE